MAWSVNRSCLPLIQSRQSSASDLSALCAREERMLNSPSPPAPSANQSPRSGRRTSILFSAFVHRRLLASLVRRDVSARYQGSVAGLLWSLLTPLMMLGVYVFVFGYVFNPVRGAPSGNVTDYAMQLFAGLLVHGLLAETLQRAATAVVSQPSYVKKVVFPVELLPLTVVGAALVQFFAGLLVLLLFLVLSRAIFFTGLLLPWVLLPAVVMCAGVALAVSSLAVYLRDITQITGLLSSVLMFLSPVFYPLSALPGWLQTLVQWLNPLAWPIEAVRDVLLRGRVPGWEGWIAYSAVSLVIFALGCVVFGKLRRGFADVL